MKVSDDIRTLFDTIEWTAIAISFLANSLVIIMATTKSGKHIGNYKYYIIAFAVHDLLFTALCALFRPVAGSLGGKWFLFMSGVGYFDHAHSLYGATHCVTLQVLLYSFIYRYTLLCKPDYRQYLETKWTFVVLLIGYLAAVVAGETMVRIGYVPTAEALVNMTEHVFKDNYPDFNHELFMFNEGFVDWKATTAFFYFVITSFIQLVGVFFCSRSIIKAINKVRGDVNSQSIASMQFQLFLALVLQLLAPVVCIYMPEIMAVGFPLLGLKVNIPPGLNVLFPLFPAFDGLVVMIVVKDYRMALLGWTRKFLKGPTEVTTYETTLSVPVPSNTNS